MREQMKTTMGRNEYRRKLLATASAAVLMATACGAAQAGGTDHPILWIEGGWHFEKIMGKDESFDPPLADALVAGGLPSPLKHENQLALSYGAEGSIIFQPENSDWLISASIRYGRAQDRKKEHKELPNAPVHETGFGGTQRITTPLIRRYSDAVTSANERHVIADFMAGRDVGLGLFSAAGNSTVSAGIRFAQFHSGSSLNIHGDPTAHVKMKYFRGAAIALQDYQLANASGQSERRFTGLGPSLSWRASAPLAGNAAEGQLILDWGLNGAVLFGRQHARVKHQTSSVYHRNDHLFPKYTVTSYSSPPQQSRSRRVTVPNLGGFAGISYQFVDAKLSIGYRADYFFNAMDGGIDARKAETRGFNGPFASISIGMGD